jgi:hypothetical protein
MILGGCAKRTTDFAMGEPITMGPFTFEVDRTEESESSAHPSEGPIPDIKVYFRMLDNRTEPFGTTIDEFLLRVRVVDRAGNTIESGGPRIISGDRRHPGEWFDDFTISPSLMGVHDRRRLGQSASDFTLVIDNPQVRAGQPERAAIALR